MARRVPQLTPILTGIQAVDRFQQKLLSILNPWFRLGTDAIQGLPVQIPSASNDGESLIFDNASQSWVMGVTAGGVTEVDTGTGLTGGPITTTGTIALANTAVTAGSYTNTSLTVDAQGRLTAASSGTAPVTSVGATAPIASSGGTTPTISHNDSGAAAGGYTNASVTVDAKGHVTAASSGTAPVTSVGVTSPITSTGGTTPSIGVVNQGTTHQVLHGNAAGNASFSAVDLTADVSGVLPIANGGTSASSLSRGAAYSTGSALATTAGTSTTVLHGNASGTPSFSAVDLTADVSSILPIASGGTSVSSFTANTTAAATVLVSDGSTVSALTHPKDTVLQTDGSLVGFAAINLATSAVINGQLPTSKGGTGQDLSASTGALSISSGTVSAGTLAIANGGTGATSLAQGAAYSTGSALATTAGTTTTVLHGNASGNPSFSAVNLANDVTGTLAIGSIPTGTTSSTVTIGNDSRFASRPAVNSDELYLWRANDASSPLVNTGSASNGNAASFGTIAKYQASGPFAQGVQVTAGGATAGFQSGADVSDVPNAFSVSAWIYLSCPSGATAIIASKDNNDTGTSVTHSSFNLYLDSGAKANFIVSSVSANDQTISAPGVLGSGLHFIVGTYTSGSQKLYIDGNLVASTTSSTGNVTQYSTKYCVGGRTSVSQGFPGVLYEIRVNSSALAASTIQSQWATGMGWQ